MTKIDITQRLRQLTIPTFMKRGEAYLAVAFLVSVICLFYRSILAGTAIFWGGDITIQLYPVYDALGRAIRSLDFSGLIWSPAIFNGYPLLAEGQLGAFYPFAWLTLPWLPSLYALNLAIVSSYLLGALATCWFARLIGIRWAGATFAGFVFAFNGFATAHLTHVPLIQGLPWLPIVLCLVELSLRRRNLAYTILAGAAWAMQWFAGHPQMAFMTIILVAMYAIYRTLFNDALGAPLHRRLFAAGRTVVTIGVVGVALAAVYLLPLQELGTFSIRPNARLSYEEIVTYSLPWRNLLTAVIPFFFGGSQGDYWGLWNLAELGFYMGIPTIVLALTTLIAAKPRPIALFFAFAALASLLLALGGNTPLYRLLYSLPVFGSLRAPARFVYLLVFCLAILAGLGIDTLSRADISWVRRRINTTFAMLVVLAGIFILAVALAIHQWLLAQPPEIYTRFPGWLVGGDLIKGQSPAEATYHGLLKATDPGSIYTYLPSIFLMLTGVILLQRGRLFPGLGSWLWVLLLVADLGVYTARMPPSGQFPLLYATTRQSALDFVVNSPGLQRVYWIRDDQPWSVLTMESLLYPGLADIEGYTPLQLRRHYNFMQAFWGWETYQSQDLLDAMNVRFVVDSTKLSQHNSLIAGNVRFIASHPIAVLGDGGMANRIVYNIPQAAVSADQLEFVSSFEGSEIQGQPEIVRLTLIDTTGMRHPVSLQANIHTAHRRLYLSNSAQDTASETPEMVYESLLDHAGTLAHYYYSGIALSTTLAITSLEVAYTAPSGQFNLFGLSLVGQNNQVMELSPYMSDIYQPAYNDQRIAVYENKRVLPRAYVVNAVRKVEGEEAALQALRAPGFAPAKEVILEDSRAPIPHQSGGEQSEVEVQNYSPMRVDLKASMRGDGYLVLSDTYFPGWKCEVDGVATPIYQANYLFRAVYLPSGEHTVTFTYQPLPLRIGGAISVGTLIAVCVVVAGSAIRHRLRKTAQAS